MSSCLDGLAAAPSGTSTTRTSVAHSTIRRLPLPQSALEREPSPRLPLPQRTLARTLRRLSPLLIPLLSKARSDPNRNVGPDRRAFVTLSWDGAQSSLVRVTSR